MKRVLLLFSSIWILSCSVTDKTGYDVDLQYMLLHDGSSVSAISPDNDSVYNYSNKDYTSIRNTVLIRNIKDNDVVYNIRFENSAKEFYIAPAIDGKTGQLRDKSCFTDNITLPIEIPLKSKEYCLVDISTRPTDATVSGDIEGLLIAEDNEGKATEYTLHAKVLSTHKFDRVFSNTGIIDKVIFSDNHTVNDTPVGLLIDGNLQDIKVAFSFLAETGIIIDKRTTCDVNFKTTDIYTNGMPCYIFFNYQPKVDINQKHSFNIKAKLRDNDISYKLRMEGYLDKAPEITLNIGSTFRNLPKQPFDKNFVDISFDIENIAKLLATRIDIKTIEPKIINDKVMDFALPLRIEQNYLEPHINIEEASFALVPTLELEDQCILVGTDRVIVRNMSSKQNKCTLSIAFSPFLMLEETHNPGVSTSTRRENIDTHCFKVSYSKEGVAVTRDCSVLNISSPDKIAKTFLPYQDYSNLYYFHHLFRTSGGNVMLMKSMGADIPLKSPEPKNLGNEFLGYNFTDATGINSIYPRKRYTIEADDTKDRTLQLFFPSGVIGWRMVPYEVDSESCITTTEGVDNISAITIDLPQGESCSLYIESNGDYSFDIPKPKLQPFIIFDKTTFAEEVNDDLPLTDEKMRELDNITSLRFYYMEVLNNVVPPCRKIDGTDNRLCETKFPNTNVEAISSKVLSLLLTKSVDVDRYRFEFSDNFRRGFQIDPRTTCKGLNYTTEEYTVSETEGSCYLVIAFNPKDFNSGFEESMKVNYIKADNSSRFDEFILSGRSDYNEN